MLYVMYLDGPLQGLGPRSLPLPPWHILPLTQKKLGSGRRVAGGGIGNEVAPATLLAATRPERRITATLVGDGWEHTIMLRRSGRLTWQ